MNIRTDAVGHSSNSYESVHEDRYAKNSKLKFRLQKNNDRV
jgi:hypothetical protein